VSKYERYDKAFVDMIKKADKDPPERYVRTLDELIEFLLEEDGVASPLPNGTQHDAS
jgi:hypothetical protein